MEFLRYTTVLIILLLDGSSAEAKFIPALSSLDWTNNGSVAAGRSYNMGTTVDLSLGSKDDPVNNTASLHGNYSRQMSPLDPPNPESRLKDVNNFSGGVSVFPLEKTLLGVDLDSASDHFEGVFTNGVKISVGYEPLKLSYRYAGSTIESTLPGTTTIVNGHLVVGVSHEGAFIYQHTLELEGNFELTQNDLLTATLAGSTFSPGVNLFANALAGRLAALSTFADTLQSFEQYGYGLEWRHYFNDAWDSKLSSRISHEVITADTQLQTSTGIGYRLSSVLHVQAGWDYSHDSTTVANTATLELKITWDRNAPAAEAAAGAGGKSEKSGSTESD